MRYSCPIFLKFRTEHGSNHCHALGMISERLSYCAISTVYPKKYAHGFCFAVLCCGYTLTDFPISIRLTSLALWQSNDCPSGSKANLMNMDKYFMWIHYERLHNHNKAKHNKTVCIFLGIYCTVQTRVCLIWVWDAFGGISHIAQGPRLNRVSKLLIGFACFTTESYKSMANPRTLINEPRIAISLATDGYGNHIFYTIRLQLCKMSIKCAVYILCFSPSEEYSKPCSTNNCVMT